MSKNQNMESSSPESESLNEILNQRLKEHHLDLLNLQKLQKNYVNLWIDLRDLK